MTVWPARMTGESASRLKLTSVPLTATEPIVTIVTAAPSAAVTAKRSGAGSLAASSSSASSKSIASEVPAAATLAETGAGAAMSALVACSTPETGPRPSPLIAETR